MQVLSPEALLKHQQLLPDELRQNCVILVFTAPVCSDLLNEFLTIRLTDLMYGQGEDQHYMVNRFQPERLGSRVCPMCRQAMQQQSLHEFACTNRRCAMSSTGGLVAGPRSGVIGVRTAPEFVVRTEGTQEYVDKCVIVLDRRYKPSVLAAVVRTANWIAEERGWQLA